MADDPKRIEQLAPVDGGFNANAVIPVVQEGEATAKQATIAELVDESDALQAGDTIPTELVTTSTPDVGELRIKPLQRATGQGTPVSIYGGKAEPTDGNGGPVSLSGGEATGDGNGGAASLVGGVGKGTGNGGGVRMMPGIALGSGLSGRIKLQKANDGWAADMDLDDLSADRTYTFPDADGVLALEGAGGDVNGPSSSVEHSFASYASTDGKTLEDTNELKITELGTKASGTLTVSDFSVLTGQTFTLRGITYTEGAQWTAATDNDTTAQSIALAVSGDASVTVLVSSSVVTFTAAVTGDFGNTYSLSSSDPDNLIPSGVSLAGGVSAVIVANSDLYANQFAAVEGQEAVLHGNSGRRKPVLRSGGSGSSNSGFILRSTVADFAVRTDFVTANRDCYLPDISNGIFALLVGAPASASDTGVQGSIAYDNDYFYICVATDTWVRTGLNTW